MLWKHLAAAGLAAAATTTAQASLVVPDVSADDFIKALPVVHTDSPIQSESLKLDCPGCPVRMRNHRGRYDTKTAIASHLELNFAVEPSPNGGDRLLVNGIELYPRTASWYSPLRAHQVVDFAEAATKHPRKFEPDTPQLGYMVTTGLTDEGEGDERITLIEIDLDIFEVGATFIDGIPNVNAKLLETSTGKIMVASLEATPSNHIAKHMGYVDAPDSHHGVAAGDQQQEEEQCQTLLCSWRSAVVKALKSFRPGCFSSHRHHGHGHGHGHGGHRHGHHDHDGHRHKHMQSQYRKHHTWGRLFKNVAWSIIIPVFFGLLAGIAVSVLGMLVGTSIVFIWRVFARRQTPWMQRHCRRRRAHSHSSRNRSANNKASRKEVALVEDEKSGLMALHDEEDVADLPPYEEEARGPSQP